MGKSAISGGSGMGTGPSESAIALVRGPDVDLGKAVPQAFDELGEVLLVHPHDRRFRFAKGQLQLRVLGVGAVARRRNVQPLGGFRFEYFRQESSLLCQATSRRVKSVRWRPRLIDSRQPPSQTTV